MSLFGNDNVLYHTQYMDGSRTDLKTYDRRKMKPETSRMVKESY